MVVAEALGANQSGFPHDDLVGLDQAIPGGVREARRGSGVIAVQTSEQLGQAALEYARRGWRVFPCQPRGKVPLVDGGFKAATVDAEQIRSWWEKWTLANIGIPTGLTSTFAALDVDPGGEVSAPVRKHISCAALVNIGRCGFGRASTRGRGCGM
jgi:hypothetical protein